MKVIIAGSRTITSFEEVDRHILKAIESGLEITEVVSGRAAGVDRVGEEWAIKNTIPVKRFKADWDNIFAPGAVVKKNARGQDYNVKARFDRNELMAQYADALILIWGGISPGSRDMKARALKHNLKIFEVVV